MPLSDVTIDAANRAIREVFETSSVAWRTIPHWETGDPAQTAVRADTVFQFPDQEGEGGEEDQEGEGGEQDGDEENPQQPPVGPFGAAAVPVETLSLPLLTTLAQATAPTPDQVVAAATFVAAHLTDALDRAIGDRLVSAADGDHLIPLNPEVPAPVDGNGNGNGNGNVPKFGNAGKGTPPVEDLIKARTALEEAGFHAPRAVWANADYMTAFHNANGPDLILHAISQLLQMSTIDSVPTLKRSIGNEEKPAALLIGRRQVIAPGKAYEYAPGPEPIDIAVAVPPSLEIIGDNATGNVELAVRLRYALRFKDERGVVVWHG